MRFKKAPLRTGMEGAEGSCLRTMSTEVDTAIKYYENIEFTMSQGRPGAALTPVRREMVFPGADAVRRDVFPGGDAVRKDVFPGTDAVRRDVFPGADAVRRDVFHGADGTRDQETQEAQAKLRQYEALGLIKVEVEESPEELEEPHPGSEAETVSLQPHTNTAMIVTPMPVSMANLQTTHSLPETGTMMLCSLQQQQGQHTLILPQMQPSSHTTPMLDVPILSDSEGEYGFTVTVEEKERTTKSPMWLMSRITNKLYTNINKSVPFEIHLKKPIKKKQFFIRAVPVFSSPQFLRTNVNRCPNHAAPTDSTNHDFPYPEHVIRADHPEARYLKGMSGRLSVTVPLDTLQDGSDYTPILLRFMCLGSCVGGINRRPIAVILTLENSSSKECGRKVIDVRVCACPTRDIKTDEQVALNKGVKRKCSSIQERVPIVARKKPKILDPKTEPQADDKKTFFIPVYGEKLYNFLMDMKAVYYRSHPEYAAKYPDDDVLLRRSMDA